MYKEIDDIVGVVLGTKSIGHTAKRLARGLNAYYTTEFFPDYTSFHYLFRYGNSYTQAPPRIPWIFNQARAIEIASNKPTARSVLLDNGIRCPRMFNSVSSLLDAEFPLIARPTFHFRGRNFYMTSNFKEAVQFLKKGYYLQEVVKKKKEYRIFMWNNRVFEANEKIPLDDDSDLIIRNHDNGWFFQWIPYTLLDRNLVDLCKLASNTLGLTFCAIDCALAENGFYYIFEVNSAPGLVDRKIEKLVGKVRGFLIDHMM